MKEDNSYRLLNWENINSSLYKKNVYKCFSEMYLDSMGLCGGHWDKYYLSYWLSGIKLPPTQHIQSKPMFCPVIQARGVLAD